MEGNIPDYSHIKVFNLNDYVFKDENKNLEITDLRKCENNGYHLINHRFCRNVYNLYGLHIFLNSNKTNLIATKNKPQLILCRQDISTAFLKFDNGKCSQTFYSIDELYEYLKQNNLIKE